MAAFGIVFFLVNSSILLVYRPTWAGSLWHSFNSFYLVKNVNKVDFMFSLIC